MNFLNKKNLFEGKHDCEFCGLVLSQRHFQNCSGYKDLRNDLNLKDESSLVEYYKRILKFRAEMEENKVDCYDHNDEYL